MKVLGRPVVIAPAVSTLHQTPRTLYPVGVGLPSHVLADAVPDRLMAKRHPVIGGVVVGVDRSVLCGPLPDELLKRWPVRAWDNSGADIVRPAALAPAAMVLPAVPRPAWSRLPTRLCPSPRPFFGKPFPVYRGWSGGVPTRQVSTRCLSASQAGCREPLVPAGGRGCPPALKTLGAGWWDSGAGQASPSPRGRRRPQQDHPTPATPPLQNQNKYAIVSPGSGQPVHSASSKPAVYGSTGGPQWTPTAEALREHHRRRQWQPPSRPWGKAPRGDVPPAPQPSGEARRRSERRCEANLLEPRRISDASAMDTRWMRDGYAMDTRWMRDGCAMATRWLRDASVPETPEIRLASVTTNNQRLRLLSPDAWNNVLGSTSRPSIPPCRASRPGLRRC